MKKLKKVLAILLSTILALGVLPLFASAEDNYVYYNDKVPVITVRGTGAELYDKDNNFVYSADEALKPMISDIASTLYPSLVNAVLKGDWETWYCDVENALDKTFAQIRYDENGDNPGLTDLDNWDYNNMDANFSREHPFDYGYGEELESYIFRYDWRKDSYQAADELEGRIEQLCNARNCSKVNISASCAGGTVLLAYIDKYGTGKLNNLIFDSAVIEGNDMISSFFCGEYKIDGDALERFCTEHIDADELFKPDDDVVQSDEEKQTTEILKMLVNTLKQLVVLLNANSSFESFDSIFQLLYQKIGTELMPRVLRKTVASFPHFWNMIFNDKYEKALDYVFPTRELRQQYAGLIEKTDNYQENIGSKVTEIVKRAMDDNVKIAVISKYGRQGMPVLAISDQLSDYTVTVKGSSLGATIAKNVNSTLDKSYIESQKKSGLGEYISADGQIDASTCLLRDTTWFIKGLQHDNIEAYMNLKKKFLNADGNYTVNDDPTYPRFMVYNNKTEELKPMTPETKNEGQDYESGTETDRTPLTLLQKFARFMSNLFKTISAFFDKIFFNKINNIFKK